MYSLIDARPSVRALYTQQLVARGDLTSEECDAAAADFQARLNRAFEETHNPHETGLEARARRSTSPVRRSHASADTDAPSELDSVPTAVSAELLEQVIAGLEARADRGSRCNPKLERVLQGNRTAVRAG